VRWIELYYNAITSLKTSIHADVAFWWNCQLCN